MDMPFFRFLLWYFCSQCIGNVMATSPESTGSCYQFWLPKMHISCPMTSHFAVQDWPVPSFDLSDPIQNTSTVWYPYGTISFPLFMQFFALPNMESPSTTLNRLAINCLGCNTVVYCDQRRENEDLLLLFKHKKGLLLSNQTVVWYCALDNIMEKPLKKGNPCQALTDSHEVETQRMLPPYLDTFWANLAHVPTGVQVDGDEIGFPKYWKNSSSIWCPIGQRSTLPGGTPPWKRPRFNSPLRLSRKSKSLEISMRRPKSSLDQKVILFFVSQANLIFKAILHKFPLNQILIRRHLSAVKRRFDYPGTGPMHWIALDPIVLSFGHLIALSAQEKFVFNGKFPILFREKMFPTCRNFGQMMTWISVLFQKPHLCLWSLLLWMEGWYPSCPRTTPFRRSP